MTAVFISYSRTDQPFVHRLHDALKARDRDAWVDWQGIAPTAEWMLEIQRAIDAADAALFVISPAWVASTICLEELAHAQLQGKRLVPVVCRDAPAGSVPDALAKLNWVMLREVDDFERGLATLTAGLDTDLDWVREHTRLIVRAQEWQDGGQDDASLLRGSDLADAERWLSAGATHTDPAPVPLQAAYITRSREAERKRQRRLMSGVTAAFVVALGLAIWAVIERGSAIDNALAAEQAASAARYQEGQARKNEERAVEQEGRAKAQTAIAERQTTLAEREAEAARKARDAEAQQRQAAQLAQREAERQRDEAVRQRTAAQARQLAARAEAQPASDPALVQKAVLMAAESLRLLPSVEADQLLRGLIAQLPPRRAELPHAGITSGEHLASSGDFLAFVDAQNLLRVIDTGRMVETFRLQFSDRTGFVHVNRAGRYVVIGSSREGTLLIRTGDGSRRIFPDCNASGADFGGPTASLLALGCKREIRIVDAADDTVPERRIDTGDTALALAFSPGDDQLAGVNERGDVSIWSVGERKRVARITGQTSSTNSWSRCCTAFIGWSARGRYLAANNLADNKLHVIDAQRGETHARLEHTSRVNVFAFDDDREWVAVGERNGRITVWDVPSKAMISSMTHADEITRLRLYTRSWGSDGQAELYSASTDRTARRWNPYNGAEQLRVAQLTPVLWADRRRDSAFGRPFATLDSQVAVAQWDERPPGPPMGLGNRRVGREPVVHCSRSDGQRHWIADAGGAVGWYGDARNPVQFGRLLGGSLGTALAFDPECRWLAIAVADELHVVDPAAPTGNAPNFKDKLSGAERGSAWLSPRGQWLLLRGARSPSGTVGTGYLWHTQPWRRVALPEACTVGALLLSPDERSAVLPCASALVLLDLHTGRERARLDNTSGAVAVSDSGQLLLRQGQELRVLQLPEGKQLARLELPTSLARAEIAVDAQARVLALRGDKAFGAWRLPQLTPLGLEDRSAESGRALFDGPPYMSPDGRQLLIRGADRLHLIDTDPWTRRAELIHPGQVERLKWDPARRQVLVHISHRPLERDTQHSVRAWNIDSGAELARVTLQRDPGDMTISADGRYLLAEQMHWLSPQALTDTACRLVSRNLTQREWQAELPGVPYRRTCPGLPEPPAGTPAWDQ